MKAAPIAFLASLWGSLALANGAPGTLVELVDGSRRPFERMEASGIAYVSGRLAVVDDTLNTLFLFDASGGLIATLDSPRLPEDQAKFEDLVFDRGSRTFFAVGSHSGREQEVLERQSVLYEFRLRGRDEIDDASVRELRLRDAFERLGLWRTRGMKIEGLAIDERGEALYVGLREPVDRARVYRVALNDLREERALEAEIALEFAAGFADETPYCISALVWDPYRRGLLIATSTEDDETHRFLGNRLWFWAPGSEPVLLIDRFDEGMKAEGLALGARKLFIVYDNDQDDTGIPGHLRVVPLDDVTPTAVAP